MEELLNLTSDPESKSGLEILRQCHWQNRGHKIKACSGPLVMGISSGVSDSIKVLISINWFLHQRCNIKLWISNVHILSFRLVIYNCQSTRYVVLKMFGFRRPEPKRLHSRFQCKPIEWWLSGINYLHINGSVHYNIQICYMNQERASD